MNHLALNTDYALRTGAFDPSKGPTESVTADSETLKEKALQRYTQAKVEQKLHLIKTLSPSVGGVVAKWFKCVGLRIERSRFKHWSG